MDSEDHRHPLMAPSILWTLLVITVTVGIAIATLIPVGKIQAKALSLR
jgi:hypothetical protein